MFKRLCLILILCACIGLGSMLQAADEAVYPKLEVFKTPTFTETGGFWYAYMDLECKFSETEKTGNTFFEECQKQGLQSNYIFGIFRVWSEEPGAQVDFALAFIVPAGTKVKPPLKMAKIDKFKTLTLTHPGSLTEPPVKESHVVLEKFIEKNGYKHVYPIYEIIRLDPWHLDLIYLVEKPKK